MPHLKHLLAVHLKFKKQLLQGLRDYGLMPGHPKIMYFIFNNEGCQQKDIARNCYIESATLSKVLLNMEKRGLIDRIPHRSDKRAYSIYPKKEARPVYEEVIRQFEEIEGIAFSGFSESEKKEFRNYLIRLENNLKA